MQPQLVFQQQQDDGALPEIFIPNEKPDYRAQETFVFKKVPTTVEEFIEERDKIGNTPHGGAAMFVVAMLIYSYENSRVLGMKCLTIMTDRKYLRQSQDKDSYKNFKITIAEEQKMKSRLVTSKKEYIARCYLYGNNNPSPENQYSFDPSKPFGVGIYKQSRDVENESGRIKVFVCCTGALPRPIHMQRNNRGLYKGFNWGSLQLGCRFTPPVIDDDL